MIGAASILRDQIPGAMAKQFRRALLFFNIIPSTNHQNFLNSRASGGVFKPPDVPRIEQEANKGQHDKLDAGEHG
jgi:hypothetical protein